MLIFFLQLFLQVSVNYINGSTRVYDCRNTNSTNFNVNPTVFVLPGIGNCKNVVASLKFIRTLDWGIIHLFYISPFFFPLSYKVSRLCFTPAQLCKMTFFLTGTALLSFHGAISTAMKMSHSTTCPT